MIPVFCIFREESFAADDAGGTNVILTIMKDDKYFCSTVIKLFGEAAAVAVWQIKPKKPRRIKAPEGSKENSTPLFYSN